eukprot:762174-Hanusia_phi.AAC.1
MASCRHKEGGQRQKEKGGEGSSGEKRGGGRAFLGDGGRMRGRGERNKRSEDSRQSTSREEQNLDESQRRRGGESGLRRGQETALSSTSPSRWCREERVALSPHPGAARLPVGRGKLVEDEAGK